MNREERKLLKEAARLIERELLEGRKVRIPSFGAFYTTILEVLSVSPDEMDNHVWATAPVHERVSTRFRTFRSYFRRMNNLAVK
jgi:hypothetical protein